MEFISKEHQHIRYNPLKGEWVLVSPHRLKRPWMGQEETPQEAEIPEFDPTNPLCPGVTRPNGEVTPVYTETYVFTNDYPAMIPDVPAPLDAEEDPLFRMAGARGTCRVMCFHPKTNVAFPTMTVQHILLVIDGWIDQLRDLGETYIWVQIFENRGIIMGCSNPHPHCQIWASSFLPNEPRLKDLYQREYYEKHGQPLLMDYVSKEIEKNERIVKKNANWVVLVPFWAVWPYETMVLPLTHVRRMYDLNMEQKADLAEILRILSIKYDNLFRTSFPYSMGWHGAPTGEKSKESMDHWVFHGIYYPPLLRSATVKKFMVGYEMLAQPQRDLTPEKAAETLRHLSEEHYVTEVKVHLQEKIKSRGKTTTKKTR